MLLPVLCVQKVTCYCLQNTKAENFKIRYYPRSWMPLYSKHLPVPAEYKLQDKNHSLHHRPLLHLLPTSKCHPKNSKPPNQTPNIMDSIDATLRLWPPSVPSYCLTHKLKTDQRQSYNLTQPTPRGKTPVQGYPITLLQAILQTQNTHGHVRASSNMSSVASRHSTRSRISPIESHTTSSLYRW